jgi:hypothetical protein
LARPADFRETGSAAAGHALKNPVHPGKTGAPLRGTLSSFMFVPKRSKQGAWRGRPA